MSAFGLGAAMAPQIVHSPLAFGQTQYELRIANNSNTTQTFFTFQNATSSNSAEQFHTVQLTARLDPGAVGILSWKLDYGLCWAPASHFSPGIVLTPSQILNAGLTSNNAATLAYSNNTPNLTNLHTASPSGTFMIDAAGNVPPNAYAVGVTIDGKPVTASPITANLHLAFSNLTSYAIGVGPYEVGEALNPEALTSYTSLPFNEGTTKVQVTLTQGPVEYQWTTERVG